MPAHQRAGGPRHWWSFGAPSFGCAPGAEPPCTAKSGVVASPASPARKRRRAFSGRASAKSFKVALRDGRLPRRRNGAAEAALAGQATGTGTRREISGGRYPADERGIARTPQNARAANPRERAENGLLFFRRLP